jgi:DNA-binding NarL/FixJ family response regulator
VLVLDLAMPGMDGLQVLSSVRAQHPQTRVVVASALAAERFEALVTELGAAGYFEKGNSSADLRAMVKSACDAAQAQAS